MRGGGGGKVVSLAKDCPQIRGEGNERSGTKRGSRRKKEQQQSRTKPAALIGDEKSRKGREEKEGERKLGARRADRPWAGN